MKIPFTDVTFTIPFKSDSVNRLANITRVVQYLYKNFDTNISVYEVFLKGQGTAFDKTTMSDYPSVRFQNHEQGEFFHRTKYLNIMAKEATTPMIVNYDCDVLFPIKQYVEAANILRSQKASGIFPYDGYFVNIPHLEALKEDLVVLNPDQYPNFGRNSYGGAIFWNREHFIRGGMENENFISWGHEDWERVERFTKLGFSLGRIKGPLYHMDHPRAADSSDANPWGKHNEREYVKVKNMKVNDLKEYVSTWPWVK